MRDECRIRGRRVLVTGGARGIGRCIAEALIGQGAFVVIADLDEDLIGRVSDELGDAAYGVVLDVRDREVFSGLVEELEQDSPIDILVNNAGIMLLGEVGTLGEVADRRQIDVNLHGVLNGMLAVLPHMSRRGSGHVVNIASLTGRVGVPFSAVYGATKHAVIGLTEAVRQEYRDSGIAFSYVMPSVVRTELTAGTHRLRWPRPIEPTQVADAVIDAIQRRQVEVYVPPMTRVVRLLPAVLPRRVYETLARWFRVHGVFADLDPAVRSDYRRRAMRDR